MNIQNNEHPICATCKGRCCRNMGCEISPEDVIKWKGEITEQVIIDLLDTEYISIDWWDGDPKEDRRHRSQVDPKERVANGYYLRMRHVGMFAIDPSYGGVCKALRPNGCALTWDQRPTGGRLLEPNPDNPGPGCISVWGKHEAALAWLPYNKLLEKVRNTYGY